MSTLNITSVYNHPIVQAILGRQDQNKRSYSSYVTIATRTTLRFTESNSKLEKLARHEGLHLNEVVQFDLPAAYTCPKARECKCMFNPMTGTLVQGKDMRFECYAAKAERQYANVALTRWCNYLLLKQCGSVEKMAEFILQCLPKKVKIVRLHSSGDLFTVEYFKAWCLVAKARPEITVFGYTKVMAYVIAEKPENFRLQFSLGSDDDDEVDQNTPVCHVVPDHASADYPVVCATRADDHSDYGMIMSSKSFCLIVH